MFKIKENKLLYLTILALLSIVILFNFFYYAFFKFYPNVQVFRQYGAGEIGLFELLSKSQFKTESVTDYFVSIYNYAAASNDFSKEELPIYQLYINGEKLDELNSNLPWSGDDYKDAWVVLPDHTNCKARVKYRGELFWHWWYPQKSLRIKLEQTGCPHNMSRTFNLINPKTLIAIDQSLSAYIGKEMGLLSPEDYFVEVYINGKYMGVYEYLPQTNEQFLRKNKRLPGNYYQGENYSLPHRIFSRPDSWVKMASNNQFDENDNRDILHLLNLVNQNYSEELVDFIDTDKFLKYYSHSQIFGYFHAGGYHNHKFYFDPSSGRFEPTVWDTTSNSMFTFEMGLDFVPNRFFYVLFMNPRIVSKKNEYLYGYVTNDSFFSLFESYFEKQYGLLYSSLSKDKYKDYNTLTGNRPYTMGSFDQQYQVMLEYYKTRQDFIKHRLDQDSDVYVFRDQTTLNILVYGETTVIAECTVPLKPTMWSGNATVQVSSRFELFPGRKNKKNEFGNDYDDYDLDVSGIEYNFQILNQSTEVSCRFFNELTKTEIDPSFVKDSQIWNKLSKKLTSETVSIHPWLIPTESPSRQIRFGPGDHELNETLVLQPHDTLIIEPGARLLFQSNISIISFGNITAVGTKGNEIVFTSKDGEPWGVVALQGKEAFGVFENCVFEFGSQTYFDWVWYTGTLSVYNAHATVKASIFQHNKISDDMLNAKLADFSIQDSLFNHSLADAIDFDFTDGLVINNTFLNSGNDAIDLMGSVAFIANNSMYNSGDKGISVGEFSSPVIFNNKMINGSIGIEIKDMSEPTINKTEITDNRIGINSYLKTLRYDYGGRGLLVDSIVCRNGINFQMDNTSVLTIHPNLKCDFKRCITEICR